MADPLSESEERQLREQLLRMKFPGHHLSIDSDQNLQAIAADEEAKAAILSHWGMLKSTRGTALLLINARESISLDRGAGPNNYLDWCKYSAWTTEEAALLTLSLDPRDINSAHIYHRVSSDLARRYLGLIDQIRRAVEVGDLKRLFSPTEYITWARRREIPVALDLEVRVQANTSKISDTDQPLSTQRRKTLYTMILLMAVDGYGYTPGARNPTAQKLATRAKILGFSIGEDTIREYLRQARDYLDWTPIAGGDADGVPR